MKLKMYTQKINWKMCKKINELPVSYKEGSVFISYENKPFGL